MDRLVPCRRLGLAGVASAAELDCPAPFHLRSSLASLLRPSAGVHPALTGLIALPPGFSRPMSVVKKTLSTDMLPQGLDDRQRFMHFAELFEHFSNTGELDPAPDVPFRAAMNSIHIGTHHARPLRRHLHHGPARISPGARRPMTTAIASRATPAIDESRVIHRGREIHPAAGRDGAAQARRAVLCAPTAPTTKRFTNVHLPTATLRAMVAGVDEWSAANSSPAARCRWRWITAICC